MVLSIYLVGFAVWGEGRKEVRRKERGGGCIKDCFTFFFISFFFFELQHKVDQ